MPSAGDNLSIICRLDGVVERLVDKPVVNLTFINPPGGAPGDQSQDESAYIRPRIFNPVTTSDVGTYTGVATIITSGTFVSTSSRVLQIQSNLSLHVVHSAINMFTCSFIMQFLLPSSPSPSYRSPLHCMSVLLST